jgi:hypothetical protein
MDNRFWPLSCPAKMADGRHSTNYMNSRVFNQKIREINNINSSSEYRHFLQKNADQIMENERKFIDDNFKCTVKCKDEVPIKEEGSCHNN